MMGFVVAATFPNASSITAEKLERTTLWHKTGKIQNEGFVKMSFRHTNFKLHSKVIEEGSIYQECGRKHVMMKATSGPSIEYETHDRGENNTNWDLVKDALYAFYKFIRPMATFSLLLGATLQSLIAVEKLADLSLPYFIGLLQVLVTTFFNQIFMAGLNQLYDVEIDKINKSYLPLISGELSIKNGVIIVSSSLIMGFLFVWIIGSRPLFWSFFIGALVAAAYCVDLPFLRWKRYPVLTALNSVADLAIVKPLGYFLHMQTHVFKRPATFSRPLIFSMAMFSVFAVIIALFKDIPDMEGDSKFGIQSLSLRLGQKQVFWICVSLLQMAYGVAILVGMTSPFLWSKVSMGLGHGILASLLWYHAKSVDMKSIDAFQSFYAFLWKLFTAECFLVPLFR